MPNQFTKMEPILAGWSGDKKYCVTQKDGTKGFLRISPIERFESRKVLFDLGQQAAALGVPMCEPLAFGTCEEGVYSLHSWVDGEDLRPLLPEFSQARQYALGAESGKVLRKIHSIPAPEGQTPWAAYMQQKIDRKIQVYSECGVRFAGDENVLAYIAENRHLLRDCPQCFQHGDYHDGNMMLAAGKLVIIDFDRHDFGDPWEEFNRIAFSAQSSAHFASGQLHGYFGGEPPEEFFRLLALYLASNMLSSITWAVQCETSDMAFMQELNRSTLLAYDNMQTCVPSWYVQQTII